MGWPIANSFGVMVDSRFREQVDLIVRMDKIEACGAEQDARDDKRMSNGWRSQ